MYSKNEKVQVVQTKNYKTTKTKQLGLKNVANLAWLDIIYSYCENTESELWFFYRKQNCKK